MSYNAGTAFLQIVPSFAGVVDRIEEKFLELGRTAGSAFKRAFEGDTEDAQPGPSDESAARKGDDEGRAFADAFKLRIDLSRPDIHVGVDTGEATAELAALEVAADGASGAAGSGGGLSGLASSAGEATSGISPMIPVIGSLATALIPIAGVAAGAVSTLPAMLAGAGLGVGALYLGFQGLNTAIKAYTATQNTAGETAAQVATKQRDLVHAMATLSPAAQTFVTFAGSQLVPMFQQIQGAVQQALLPALTTAFQTMQPVFGVFEKFLVRAASGIGGLVDQFAKWLSSSQGMTLLNQFLTAGWNFMEQMGGILVATIIPAFAKIAVAAVPILQAMGREAQKLAFTFATWVRNGGFTRFVDWVMKNGQTVVNDLLQLTGAALQIVIAFAPLGSLLLKLLPYLTEFLAFLMRAPALLSALAIGIGAVGLALLLMMDTNPVGLLITAISLLVIGLVELVSNWTKVWSEVKSIGLTAWHWLYNNVLAPIVNFFTGLPGQITSALSGLGSAISGAFSSAFGWIEHLWNSTVGSISFTIPSWIPGIGGDHFGFPKMRATGGPAAAGMPYIIGERGPELFVPSVPGVIVPNKDLTNGAVPEPARALKPSLVQNISVTAYDPRTAAVETMKRASWTAKTRGY